MLIRVHMWNMFDTMSITSSNIMAMEWLTTPAYTGLLQPVIANHSLANGELGYFGKSHQKNVVFYGKHMLTKAPSVIIGCEELGTHQS